MTQLIQHGDRVGQWTVLNPSPSSRLPQADDNAVVLRSEINGVRVLLLSDLGKPGQNALMTREKDLRADIVVTGLPVQTEPVADALLDAIQPRVLVVADAAYPASARAGRKLRERLARRDFPVLYTLETGAITLELQRGKWQLRTQNGLRLSSGDAGKSD